ncbi:hypothetical protein EV141_1573 [Microcella putealis]|uniref:Uncharacterized protein n=1 Tax=Microcella putealis TaxID=337005 RepID=A0A4Q7LNZ2_9MICO|nr:heavy metal transporter [Microcella putealis]RZS56121.1 hypothetical protein EV141_1573 [Microcella putealis]TQM23448.1 hypothetical protein BJ957_1811 [Microcella putealis]
MSDDRASESAPAPGAPDATPASANPATPPRAARVRVAAPRAGEPLAPRAAEPLTGGAPASAERVLVASLIRSQLRVAIVCALGFASALAAVAFVAALPALNDETIAGVPVGWLVLAFGAYPPLVAIAALAVTAANRAEDQYRALAERDEDDA